jgi:DNA-binding SARP family transcriptional activator
MALKDLVIQSQLIPPRQRRGVLRRPRLETRLAAVLDHPLTIVQAGTGYGKSTALAALSNTVNRLYWYTVTEPDRDPLLFLAHLICAVERTDPSWCEAALRAAEESGGRVAPVLLTPLINALTTGLDEEAVLILDDYHLVADVPEIAALVERLVDYVPPRLHVVVSSRQLPPLASLNRWLVKGQVLSIGRTDLAFTDGEIYALFREQYDYPLSLEQAQALATETEGWAIALQMVWQSLQSGAVSDLDAVLGQHPTSLDALFDYLAQEVLARQPPTVQRFLLTTSVLRQMDGRASDRLLESQGSAARLEELHYGGLFVVSMGDGVYRYHGLFHDFLRTKLNQSGRTGYGGHGRAEARALHRRAAQYYQDARLPEETIYHLLQAEEFIEAACLVQKLGPRLIRLGRFDSFGAWIADLPASVRESEPGLYLLMGDILRLRSQFEEALAEYGGAERLYMERNDRLGRSQALRGQAQVYLDTVRPLKADSLLEEALRLLDPNEHRHETAALLERLAENKLNLGHPDEAQALDHEARLLRAPAHPGDVYLQARSMIRTGKLAAARRLLEQRAGEERQAEESRPQRFHRETVLLLSLVHALEGNEEGANLCAREGLAIGSRLESAFVEAVGHMRLGHAIQLQEHRPWSGWASADAGAELAITHYRQAIEQVRAFEVMRTQVEALWGLCRVHGYWGDIAEAETYAHQALGIIQRAGDEWMENLIRDTLGAGFVQAGRYEPARSWLTEASSGFSRVGDHLGLAAATLWLALGEWRQNDLEMAMEHMSSLLPLAREHGYDSLLLRPTFLGLKDEQAALPLLAEARGRGLENHYSAHLLDSVGMGRLDYHPGYRLSVRTLGPFAVWRDDRLITARNWQREKARRIFQFLLTNRGQWFFREQIIEQLWPHLPPDAAERDFKVALNALNRALEPNRPSGVGPFFVVRRPRRNVYGLNPAATIIVDVDDFERLAASEDVDALRKAVALYEDDYLPGCLYEDWPAALRRRLREQLLSTAERLGRNLLQAEEWDEAVQVCETLLAFDNSWESAYRLLMRIYAARNNRPQVHAVYQRCAAVLHDELGVEPSTATQALLAELS